MQYLEFFNFVQEVSLERRLGWIIRDNGQLGLSDRDTSSVGTNCHSYKNELAALRLSYIHSSWEQAKTWWVRQQAKNHSSSLLAAAILYYNIVCLLLAYAAGLAARWRGGRRRSCVGHNTSRDGCGQKWSSWAATKTCSQANLWVPRTLFYSSKNSDGC